MTNFCTARTTLVVFVAVSLGAASLAACGDDRRMPGGGSFTEDNAADQVAAAACGAAFRCCEPGAEVDRFLDVTAATASECRTAVALRLRADYAELTPGVAAGHVFFDRAAGERCVSALGAAACGRSLLSDESFIDCRNVYSGTRDVGESCTETGECVQPVHGDTYCNSGTCAIGALGVANGESCSDSTAYCFEGFCDSTSVCVARRAVGGTCTYPAECASNTCTGGSCANAPPPGTLLPGAACTSSSECQSADCECADAGCITLACAAPICDGV